MKAELLSIIEFMERDRGLDRGTVINAVEQAIETAARKIPDVPNGSRVKINPETGEISAYGEVLVVEDDQVSEPIVHDDEETVTVSTMGITEALTYSAEAHVGATIRINVDVNNFGRVAAQTAKQVIVQKIREAEREKILTEYSNKIGDLVHGTISRIEKNNLIVDIGPTEAFMPRKEQSPIEHYRQGDRIRALVSDVKDTEEGRVPRVILSRGAAALIRRLFELEVPEIYDGIVEIKAIAREAGFRTKVAVISHDAKIDSVGACVGIRGTRVKNIVQEISGEKIDIVRWNESVENLVTNALAPVDVVRMFADDETERILVVVPDDQLSLAIGKSGQNIRLTSKLVGWKVDAVRQSDADRVAKEHGVDIESDAETGTESIVKTENNDIRKPAVATSDRVSSIFNSVEEVENEEVENLDNSEIKLSDIDLLNDVQVQLLAELGVETVADFAKSEAEVLQTIEGLTSELIVEISNKI